MSAPYLVDPSVFPARAEGDPWGSESLGLRIADQGFRVHGLSSLQQGTLRALWESFLDEPGSAEATSVSLFRVAPSLFRSFDRRGWSYALDFRYGAAHTHVTGIDLMARIDWEERLAGALWVATEEPETFHGAFENFLRVLAAHALLLAGGLLLHSAAVVERSGARLFVGPSGAGKSTTSGLARATGRYVVSDDMNLVVRRSERFDVAGSPFFGDIGSREQGSYPLRGIYRLEKGTRDDVRPMGEGESFASLIACSPFVNRSPYLVERLWSNLGALTRDVPSYVLTFRRQGDFWPLLEATC